MSIPGSKSALLSFSLSERGIWALSPEEKPGKLLKKMDLLLLWGGDKWDRFWGELVLMKATP